MNEVEATYMYICPVCRTEMFSNEPPEDVVLEESLCLPCNTKVKFHHVGSINNKEKE